MIRGEVLVPTECLSVALKSHVRKRADTSTGPHGFAEEESIGLKLSLAQASRCLIAVCKHPVDKRFGPAVPVKPLVV